MKPLIDADLTKVCRLCKEQKLLSEYHPNKTCKLGVVGTCKDCYKVRVGKWYSDNRKRRQDVANTRNRERKKLAVQHFGGACYDCKKSYPPCVFEFHHLDPTKKDVNPSHALTRSESRMWEELEKCVMLCSNCHKIRHFASEEGGSDVAVN